MKNTSTLVLVGGYGFVGRNLIDHLDREKNLSDFAPIVIDDLSNAAPGHETLDVPGFIGSYEDAGAVPFIDAQGPGGSEGRVFVFLAGETRVAESKDRPMDFIEANITAPSRFVMQAVKPGDKFILVSTAGALFDGTFEVRNTSAYCPKNFYGATKAAEEMILQKLVEMRGASFAVVRMTNVFGVFSERKKSAIHAFTRAAISGDGVVINGDGMQSRDFIFSRDVARGITALAVRMRDGAPHDVVNTLGSGISTTLMDVVAAIESVARRPLNYEKIPAEALLATEPRDVMANAEDVRALLGDGITDFVEGIRQTHAYYAR